MRRGYGLSRPWTLLSPFVQTPFDPNLSSVCGVAVPRSRAQGIMFRFLLVALFVAFAQAFTGPMVVSQVSRSQISMAAKKAPAKKQEKFDFWANVCSYARITSLSLSVDSLRRFASTCSRLSPACVFCFASRRSSPSPARVSASQMPLRALARRSAVCSARRKPRSPPSTTSVPRRRSRSRAATARARSTRRILRPGRLARHAVAFSLIDARAFQPQCRSMDRKSDTTHPSTPYL